ncbi:MAG TPA: VOC family protein [Acidimicrobiales bacterium]|nr:VOC family protein [Acidimicrobiales bacterium]
MATSAEAVIPVLVYEDIAAAHDFLVEAFGFGPGRIDLDADSNPVHGEVDAQGQTIWLHRALPDIQLAPPKGGSVVHGGLVVRVADVDAHCARARAAGAWVRADPQDQPYGHREYEARDPEGHRWWFATVIDPTRARP